MPAYGAIPDSQIDADSILIADTLFKLRDNLEAYITGDPTAPAFYAYVLEQDSATFDASTSRSGVTDLGSVGGGYYEFLNLVCDTPFPASVTATVTVTFEFNTGGGAGGDQNGVRVQQDGVTVWSYGSYDETEGQVTATFTVTLGTAASTLSFQADPQFAQENEDFTGSMVVNAGWL